MQSKTLLSILICFATIFTAAAQSRNPFASIGKKVEVVTLTNGEYDEFFDDDSIQLIGTAWVNINTMQVVKLQLTKKEEKLFDNSTETRFLSVDPLTKKYAMLTPYQYASNRPIDGIDVDGLEHYHYTLELLKDRTTQLKLKSQTDIKANVIDRLFGFKDNDWQAFSVDFEGKTYEFEGSTPNPFKNWNSDFEYFISNPKEATQNLTVKTFEEYKNDWYVYSFQQEVMEQCSKNMVFFGATEEILTPKAQVGNNATGQKYREVFFEGNPNIDGKIVVHHAVEQQVLKNYPSVFTPEEMHSLENLRGIPIQENNVLHLSIIRRAWTDFYKANANPTKEAFLAYATEIDSKYGHLFNPAIVKSAYLNTGSSSFNFSKSLIILMGLNTNSQSKDTKTIKK